MKKWTGWIVFSCLLGPAFLYGTGIWVEPAYAGEVPTSAAAKHELDFQSTWDTRWHNSANQGACILSWRINDLGEARFVARAGDILAFELQLNRDMFAAGALQVYSRAPDWAAHPSDALEPLGELTHISGGGAISVDAVAGRMLWAMRQGRLLELHGAKRFARYGVRRDATQVGALSVRVALKITGFPTAVRHFLTCAETEIQVAWENISRTRLSYEVNEFELTASTKQVLNAVIQYVQQDPGVATIFVDGHTDSSGSKRQNLTLSKRRSDRVVAYMRQQGLTDHKIIARYHSDNYPIVENKLAQDMARNRRTTVRLARHDGPTAYISDMVAAH